MKVITVESEAFSEITNQINEIKQNLKEIIEGKVHANKPLMNNDELKEFLGVSKRTLQNYRDKGLIGFSQVGSKIYYTNKNIQDFIEKYQNNARRR